MAAPTAIQQRLRVGRPLLRRHVADHPLVAGQLHIPAEKDIRRPHQRVIPVHRQQQEAQRLPQVIAPPQMSPFMPQDADTRRFIHAGGQVDTGSEHPQNKGGLDAVAQVDIALQRDGRRYVLPQAQIARQRQHQHHIDTHRPQDGGKVHIHRAGGRLGPGDGVRRRCGVQHGAVRGRRGLRRYAGQQRGGTVSDVAAETCILKIRHLTAGLYGISRQPVDRQVGLERHGAHQPHRHQRPQRTQHPFGRQLFQQRTQQQERRDQPAGGHRQIQ